ncbi:MAG: GNAT family N-acetyltransferase [Thermoplasmata archaeon]|nr:GNAT family N-acetyltransferase [Thermoplasmata archaeon]
MHSTDSKSTILRKTDNFEAIRRLSLESGLEDGEFENIVCAYGYFIDGEIVGCVAMKRVDDAHSVEWLAVKEEQRGKGLGQSLVAAVAVEAERSGARELWALARVPEFFLRIGFMISSPEESPGPTFEGCGKCGQYKISCFPKVVVKVL